MIPLDPNSISNNFIIRIAERKDAGLWIATTGVAFTVPIVTTNFSPDTGMIQKILTASALILSISEWQMNRESGGLANRLQQKFILTNDTIIYIPLNNAAAIFPLCLHFNF